MNTDFKVDGSTLFEIDADSNNRVIRSVRMDHNIRPMWGLWAVVLDIPACGLYMKKRVMQTTEIT